jgi:hypothetical protein
MKTISLLSVILMISFITTGLMVFVMLTSVDLQRTESSGLKASYGPQLPYDLHENGKMNLNDIAVYNGIISEISVSPTVISHDYNHDGIADSSETILFFNIG